jgi:type IV conjugative transfer system protein TraL
VEDIKYKIVEYLDEPERVLFFTTSEFLSLMLPLAFGLGTHHPGIGLLFGVLAWFLMNRFKANDGDSFLQKLLYWYFPVKLGKLKHIPSSHLRDFIG